MKNKYIVVEGQTYMTAFAMQEMPTEHKKRSKVKITFYTGIEESEEYPQVKAENMIIALQDYGAVGEDVEFSFSTVFVLGANYITEIRID